jgi:3-oxosteroid 1-dehydrogenase
MSTIPDKWDLEVDFVAVGSGGGAIMAAIIAHDLGKKTVVLEKAPKAGGVTAYSGGNLFLPNNHVMQREGIADSYEAGRAYMDFLAGDFNDPELLDVMLEAGYKAVPYLEEKCGMKWIVIRDFPDYYFPKAPGSAPEGRYMEVALFKGSDLGEWQDKTYPSTPNMLNGATFSDTNEWGGLCGIQGWDFEKIARGTEEDLRGMGPGVMSYMIKAAMVDRGIPAYLETPVKELITEDGAVIGVRAEREGKDFFVKGTSGILLAVGGYDLNEEMTRYFEGLPEWKSMCPPYVTGDNLILGGDAGAAVAAVPAQNLGCFYGYNIPGEEHFGSPVWRTAYEGSCPHALWVNREGKRFTDETFYKDFQPAVKRYDGRSNTQPNYPPYLIFDQNFCDNYPLGTYMPGDPIPEAVATRADTLRALAEKLDIDADNFEATIERFNQLVEKGDDTDFHRGEYPWAVKFTGDKTYPNPNLGKIDKPPFFGMKLIPTNCGINAAGLKINKNAQVMSGRGEPIKGLYAAGNSAAHIDTGSGYQSGVANLRGVAWGWIAAHHAIEGND